MYVICGGSTSHLMRPAWNTAERSHGSMPMQEAAPHIAAAYSILPAPAPMSTKCHCLVFCGSNCTACCSRWASGLTDTEPGMPHPEGLPRDDIGRNAPSMRFSKAPSSTAVGFPTTASSILASVVLERWVAYLRHPRNNGSNVRNCSCSDLRRSECSLKLPRRVQGIKDTTTVSV